MAGEVDPSVLGARVGAIVNAHTDKYGRPHLGVDLGVAVGLEFVEQTSPAVAPDVNFGADDTDLFHLLQHVALPDKTGEDRRL